MAFKPDHELHKRRFGRNVGLGITLAVFMVLVFGLTIAKVGTGPQLKAPSASTEITE